MFGWKKFRLNIIVLNEVVICLIMRRIFIFDVKYIVVEMVYV